MQHENTPEIPTIRDIQYLIEELDGIAARRPKNNPQLPVVLFGDKGAKRTLAQRIIVGYRNRLRDAQKDWLIPHAFISARALEDLRNNDYALLDTIENQLQDYMPKNMGRLRLTNFCAIRAILKMENNRAADLDYEEQQAAVRTLLYKKYIDKRPWLHWLQGGMANLDLTADSLRGWFSISLTLALKLIARPFIWLTYGRHLAFGRRYKWFTDQLADLGFGANNFLSSAVNLAHISNNPKNNVAIQRILLSALLHDLERSTQTSFWSIRRGRRTTPYVLLFERIAHGDTAARRFLQAFAEVRSEFPSNSLLVMAAVRGKMPELPNTDIYDNFEGAARNVGLIRKSEVYGGEGQTIVITVDKTVSEEDGSAKWWLFSHRVAMPRRSLADFRTPILGLMSLGLLIAGGSLCAWRYFHPVFPLPPVVDSCSYKTVSYTGKNGVTTSERVGIVGDKPRLECSFSEPLKTIEQQILQQNAAVKGDGFATVIFAGPLDVPRDRQGNPKSGRQNQSGLWQLQGVAQAQKSINEEAAGNEDKLQMKVLLANTGDQLKHADTVTKQIGEFAGSNAGKPWRVMGVAGISQSRVEARTMIQKFNSDYSLPVIGSTPTGDNMASAGSASYMIAAPNSRQAAVAAHFAQTEPIVGDLDDLRIARNAVIIMDDDDEYTYNLAADFRKSFSDENHQILRVFNSSADSNDDPRLPDHSLYDADTHEIQESAKPEAMAAKICGPDLGFDPNRDLIFYASRSQEFDDLLYALQHDPGCSSKLTILGGSDLNQFRDYANYPIIKDHLFFASFASSANPDNSELVAKPALTKYRQTYGQAFINESDFARAFDATYAFGIIANNLASDDNPVSKETVKTYLSGTTPLEFVGVSGYVKLAGPGKLRVPPNRATLIMKATVQDPIVHLSCGWFSRYGDDSPAATVWGDENGDNDQFGCPQEIIPDP